QINLLFPGIYRRPGTVDKSLDQRRMPVQGRSNANLQISVSLRQLGHYSWQVALQVDSKRKKVWDYQDPGDTGIGQTRHGFVQIGLGFQKSNFVTNEATRGCRGLCYVAHGFVG